MTEMTHEQQVDAYRERLALMVDGQSFTAECIGAVFYGGVSAPMDSDQEVGTILGVKHEQGMGLFGPTIWTHVKLCRGCIHRDGGSDCQHPSDLEWRLVLWVDEVRRNGDVPASANAHTDRSPQ